MLPIKSIAGLLLLSGLLLAAPAQAQRSNRAGQLENAKIAFITTRVALTPEQAQKFWPLYNEFSAKRRELNRSSRVLRRDVADGTSDQQIRDNIAQSFALRQQELNLEKDYVDRFQKVISLRQVAQLLTAERDFTKEVVTRVAGRRSVAPADK